MKVEPDRKRKRAMTEEGQAAGRGKGGGLVSRDQNQGVASITNDLLRGAEAPLDKRREQTKNGSFVLKSLFRRNATSVVENVVKMLVKRNKERSLTFKEKEDEISNLEHMVKSLKGELSKAEDSKNLLKLGLEEEKSSKLNKP